MRPEWICCRETCLLSATEARSGDGAGHCYWHQRSCYDGAYRRHQVFAGRSAGPQPIAHGHDLRVAQTARSRNKTWRCCGSAYQGRLVTGVDSPWLAVARPRSSLTRELSAAPDYFTVMGLKASTGSLNDVDDTSRNVLLDKLSAEALAVDASIGQVVRINNDSYTIVGVVDSGPNGGGQGDTLLAYMPYSTYSARLTRALKAISRLWLRSRKR